MLRVAICDDDQNFIRYLMEKIVKAAENKIVIEFWKYRSGTELLNDLYGKEEFDLLFLDILMPEVDGYAVARKFREKYHSTVLIFCSGVCPPTPESFKVMPYRYLMKQYSEQKLESELREVLVYSLKKKEQPFVWGCFDKTGYKLSPDDILYISIAKRGCTIYLHPKCQHAGLSPKMTSRRKLPELFELVQSYGFAYAHNSYIVNMKYVMKRSMTELGLADGSVLSISRSRGKEFDAAFVQYLASKY